MIFDITKIKMPTVGNVKRQDFICENGTVFTVERRLDSKFYSFESKGTYLQDVSGKVINTMFRKMEAMNGDIK